MKKSNVIKLLSVICVCALLAFAGLVLSTNTQKTSANTESFFKVVEKAEIRDEEGSYGIRFKANFTEDFKTKIDGETAELIAIVFDNAQLDGVSSDYYNNIQKKKEIVCDKSKIYKDVDDTYYANVAVTNILPENISREFSAIFFIKVGGTITDTTVVNADFSRSIEYVCTQSFLKNPSSRAVVKAALPSLGTSALPIKISNVEELALIKADADNTFEGVNFKVTATSLSIPDNFETISEDFLGAIDFTGCEVSRSLTTKIAKDTTKLTNLTSETLTVDNSKLAVENITLLGNNQADTGAIFATKSFDEIGTAYGVSGGNANIGGGGARGDYYLDFNFTKSEIQNLKSAGYVSFTFKYIIETTTSLEDGLSSTQLKSSGAQLLPDCTLKYIYAESILTLTLNSWHTVNVSLDALIESFDANDRVSMFNIGNRNDSNRAVYFAGFELSNVIEPVNIVNIEKASFSNGTTSFESGKVYSNTELKTATSNTTTCYSETGGAWGCMTNQMGIADGTTVPVKIKLAIAKEDLTGYKSFGYTTVKIPIMAYHDSATASTGGYLKLLKAGDTSIISSSIEFVGGDYEYRNWYTLEIPVQTVIDNMDANGFVTLCDNITKLGASATLYIGQITLE